MSHRLEETCHTALTLFTTVIMMLAQQYAAIGRTNTVSAISDVQAQDQRSVHAVCSSPLALALTLLSGRGVRLLLLPFPLPLPRTTDWAHHERLPILVLVHPEFWDWRRGPGPTERRRGEDGRFGHATRRVCGVGGVSGVGGVPVVGGCTGPGG